jgi:glycosyltransferase involved in cell wall biosynthesis
LNKYRICVYAIAKNEAAFAGRFLLSMGEADGIYVLDTGSSDGTAEILRAGGAVVETEVLHPFRFDTARNRALEMVPEDADICVSTDLDEVFEPGWRKKLEAAWRENQTRAEYDYAYDHDESGAPRTVYTREKIHARRGYRWVRPVHEVLEYGGPEVVHYVPGIVLHHFPDDKKSRMQYLPLLELSHAENPDDDRTAFWLGREYFFHGKYDECVQALIRHLDMPSARWDEERSASMRYIAESMFRKGMRDAARAWLYRAIAECPGVREPYLHMLRLAYNMHDWPLGLCMADMALRISEKSGSYLAEAEAWGSEIYDLGSIAAYWLGIYDRARDWAKAALAFEPENARLVNNLKLIEEKLGVG